MKQFAYLLFCVTLSLADFAKDCDLSKCQNQNCRCSSVNPPISGILPQLVSLSFHEAVQEIHFYEIWLPLLKDRTNADGSIASATFFVPHKYTNYTLVQKLYNMGHEIGVHSITKHHAQEYWRNSTIDVLIEEFEGQRIIINKFAKIPKSEIRGVRAPQLQYNGDVTFQAYRNSGLTYDHSWPAPPSERFFPYTLDYRSNERCLATYKCPKDIHPGFWVTPIIDLVGNDGKHCHQIFGCEKSGTPEEISDWLMEQVMLSYNNTRAPVSLLADAAWFETNANSLEGMLLFLDRLGQMKDVFLVSQYDIVQWMRNPVPVEKYKPNGRQHSLRCLNRQCVYDLEDERISFVSCIQCPLYYPWLGNPTGDRKQ